MVAEKPVGTIPGTLNLVLAVAAPAVALVSGSAIWAITGGTGHHHKAHHRDPRIPWIHLPKHVTSARNGRRS